MIRYRPQFDRFLQDLHARLDRLHYDLFIRSARRASYYVDPYPREDAAAAWAYFQLSQLPKESWTAVRLFDYLETVPRAEAVSALGAGLVDGLLDLGLFTPAPADALRADGYRIASFLGHYFIVGALTPEQDSSLVYLGSESYLLAQSLPAQISGRVLDLCTGSGIQAILAAARGGQAVAVELMDAAFEVARCNVPLNGLVGKVEIRQGNLWDPVGSETFDWILANPPYLPAPQDLPWPAHAWGGEDGLSVLRSVLDGLPDHLRPEGKAMLVFEILGDASDTAVSPELEAQEDFVAELILTTRARVTQQGIRDAWAKPILLANHVERSAENLDALTARIDSMLAGLGYDHHYTALLFLQRPLLHEEPGFSTVRLYDSLGPESRPHLHPQAGLILAPDGSFEFQFPDGKRISIPPDLHFLLGSLDGKRTILQVAEVYRLRGGRPAQEPEAEFSTVFEICRGFLQMGALVLSTR